MITSLPAAERTVSVPLEGLSLPGTLAWPEHPSGVVIFSHGGNDLTRCSGSEAVARQLRSAGLATLRVDLLTPRERQDPARASETALLAGRLSAATDWVLEQPETGGLVPGYLGTGSGAGAALRAAAASGGLVGAVVTQGGRPDLAGDALYAVRAPTLLIAGAQDHAAAEASRQAYRCLNCPKRLVVVPGATAAFTEPGRLEEAGRWSAEWLVQHLVMVPRWQGGKGGYLGTAASAVLKP